MTNTVPGSVMYLEDFEVGQVFATQGRTVSEADVTAFSSLTWDTNEVHTDAVAAAADRFGERIAHGVLGLSFAMGLASRLGVFEGSSVALLAVEEWTFVAPIRFGDTLRCRVEIIGVRRTSAGDTGVLDRRFTLVNQRDETVQSGRIPLMVKACPG
ncbi:MAG: MaoC/PaaZ C-terminal domain-containing protein [Aeromicrobium sp.]